MAEGVEGLSAQDQRAHRLGKLLLEKNPEIAMKAKRLAKEADPNLQIPEIDMQDAIAASEAKSEKRINELMEKQMETEAARRREVERAASREAGLDPDEVEKRIVEERKGGNAINHATMRRIMVLEQQTADPTAGEVSHGGNMPQGTPIELRPDKEVRKLSGAALKRWSADTAHKMIDELRRTRRVVAR